MGDEKILTDKQVKWAKRHAREGAIFSDEAIMEILASHDALIEKLKRIERETWVVRETGRKLK